MTSPSRSGAVLLLVGAVACGATAEAAARASEPGAIRLRLADGTSVTLIRDADAEGEPHAYRYLPANLTLARRRDGPLEFSFLPYRSDSGGEIEGGIMHLLLRWGLSEKQVAELQGALRHGDDSVGTIVGAAPVRALEVGSSWEITSKGAIGLILNRSLTAAGRVPTEPESKLAMSFRFGARDATRMVEALSSKRGPWGEKIRFRFTVDGREEEWVLENDLGTLLPRSGPRTSG